MITTENGTKIRTPKGCGLIGIDEIDRLGRVREDYGDVKSLAQSILDNGLEHPIVITPKKKKLVAGDRRIEAFLYLGSDVIPYVTLDVDDLFSAELAENTERKDFTTMETAIIIEKIESVRNIGRPIKGSKIEPFEGKKTNEVVGKIINKSPAQVAKIKEIVEVAKTSKRAEQYLKDIDTGKKSVNTVHKLVTIKKRNLPKIAAPAGKTDLLVIDPPWEFENATIRGSAAGHYDVIPLKELCEMKLPLMEDSVVFLWVPNSLKYDQVGVKGKYLSTLQTLLNAWGLTAKSEFIWIKPKPAPGSYSLTYHETLLLCFKGKPVMPAKRFPSVFTAPVGKHSKKPDESYKMILQMYPKRKAVEMFARKPHEGFEPWGNEVE
jgi:site-specific DNA-methyltransferase (adenine-specific)